MCGIAGLANRGDRQTLARMTAVQAHRGPDGFGLHDFTSPQGEYFGLGSRRLAILDLSHSADMPMSNENGSVWLVLNGEIYNFRELRAELQGKGYNFRTEGDTEVLLHLYEQYGAACLTRLNGMFAFGVLDLRGSYPKVFVARDPFGMQAALLHLR